MKLKVKRIVEVEVFRVRIECPTPNDGLFVIFVDIESGVITHPKSLGPKEVVIKARDQGVYTLIGANGEHVAELKDGYVPHGLIPGSYGDYIELEIDEDNRIKNWPTTPDLEAWFDEV